MVGNLVGVALIAVLFVLVVASLAILPGEGGAAPRQPKSSAPRRRRSPRMQLTLEVPDLASGRFQRRMKV